MATRVHPFIRLGQVRRGGDRYNRISFNPFHGQAHYFTIRIIIHIIIYIQHFCTIQVIFSNFISNDDIDFKDKIGIIKVWWPGVFSAFYFASKSTTALILAANFRERFAQIFNGKVRRRQKSLCTVSSTIGFSR